MVLEMNENAIKIHFHSTLIYGAIPDSWNKLFISKCQISYSELEGYNVLNVHIAAYRTLLSALIANLFQQCVSFIHHPLTLFVIFISGTKNGTNDMNYHVKRLESVYRSNNSIVSL